MGTRRLLVALAAVMALTACGSGADAGPEAPQRPVWAHDGLRFLGSPDALGDAGLLDSMVRRGSVRELSAEPLSQAEMAALLWSAQGVSAPSGARTVPSAGALYPLEVYVATPSELLHYVPRTSSVEVRSGGGAREAIAEAIRNVPASQAYALVAITGVPGRITGRYGDRGIRYMWMEAGHAAQNLLLAAAAMRLGAVPIGAFNDVTVAEALGLSDAEIPLYLIAVGRPVASTEAG